MDISLEFLLHFHAWGHPEIYEAGAVPGGASRLVAMDDQASFEGPRLRGTLMPGGADWQITRDDGVTEVFAHYLLRTDDGVLLEVTNRGIRHAAGEAPQQAGTGGTADPGAQYFRGTPVFRAPAGPYDWLNRSTYVFTGVRTPAGIDMWFYRIV